MFLWQAQANSSAQLLAASHGTKFSAFSLIANQSFKTVQELIDFHVNGCNESGNTKHGAACVCLVLLDILVM